MAKVNTSKERLLESAKALMHSRGYADVGVQELCNHAGIKKGSFYHFFPSKQALTLTTLEEMEADLTQKLIIPAFAKDVPPLERLRRFFRLSHAFQTETKENQGCCVLGCPFGNLALELGSREPEIRQRIEQAFNRIIAVIRDTIQEAKETGDIPAFIDPDQTAQAVLSFQEGILMMAKTCNDTELLRGQEEIALRMCGVVS
ncbi:MAG: TetR/AcrR family transcriptional regulator [Magnetococcales bacterium]|nr:TetR/AcrR family transcriptional regulator [Magnetococcales bacterium]